MKSTTYRIFVAFPIIILFLFLLFVIVMEKLLCDISNRATVKVGSLTLFLPYVIFSDELFARADENNARMMETTLNDFAEWSRLQVNLYKSVVC